MDATAFQDWKAPNSLMVSTPEKGDLGSPADEASAPLLMGPGVVFDGKPEEVV